jgi:hypothetical protein
MSPPVKETAVRDRQATLGWRGRGDEIDFRIEMKLQVHLIHSQARDRAYRRVGQAL